MPVNEFKVCHKVWWQVSENLWSCGHGFRPHAEEAYSTRSEGARIPTSKTCPPLEAVPEGSEKYSRRCSDRQSMHLECTPTEAMGSPLVTKLEQSSNRSLHALNAEYSPSKLRCTYGINIGRILGTEAKVANAYRNYTIMQWMIRVREMDTGPCKKRRWLSFCM